MTGESHCTCAPQIVRHESDKYKVKLIKGQKNTYGWEISVSGMSPDSVVKELEQIDEALKRQFQGV